MGFSVTPAFFTFCLVVTGYRSRSHTVGCVKDKMNRTSTPFDADAGRESAIDRAFNGGVSVDPISPRLSVRPDEAAAAPRHRRTASADGYLNTEIHRLKQMYVPLYQFVLTL